MSFSASRVCCRCAAVARSSPTTPFTAPRTLARLSLRAAQIAGPSGRRFYSEGELLEAAKLKLGISGAESTISETARRQQEQLSQVWDKYASLQAARSETLRQLSSMKDAEMKELFEAEISDLDEQMSEIVNQQLPSLLLPPEATGGLPIMLSLNAGIGGDEATACTGILARVYQRHAELNGWSIEMISHTEGAVTKGNIGVKEMTMKMTARDAGSGGTSNVYEMMRWEGGVHRFQRVPPNDSKGRIQSSTAAVIVLPIIPEGTDTELVDPKDVKMEVMRSRGAGGQHVNKTESAVRLTHVPTGITVSMQDSRSQHQNRAWAWDILRSRLFARKQAQLQVDRRNKRQEVISGTDRSDKIRSYSFPADRVTDHRIGFATGLEAVLNGDLEPLTTALAEDYKTRRIQDIIAGIDDVDA